MATTLRHGIRAGKRAARANVGASAAVDRYLCSSTHQSPRFAQYVLDELVEPSVLAASPACGIDLVALARHATLARRRQLRLRLAMVGALGLIIAAVPAAAATQSILTLLFLLVVACFGSCAAVVYDRLSAYRTLAAMVSPQEAMRDLAPPLDPAVEARLEELITSNVVLFEGGDAFVAWGSRLRDGWQMSLDTTKAGTDANGKKKVVTPFSPADLHKALTLAVRNSGVPDVDVHNRLFVAGGSASSVPGLLPDPTDRPASQVPAKSVKLGIEKPRPDIRTYLCVEKTSWGGELTVNLYLRAAMVSGDLFIECHAYVLLPLRAELTLVDHLPTGSFEIAFSAVRQGLAGGLGQLRRAPGELLREWGAANRRRRNLAAQRRTIRKGRPFGRGAGLSIRAAAAANERTFLFAYTDEEMHVNALQRRILVAIEAFLEQHGVDTADFQQKQTSIVNNHNYAIGAVNAQNAQVGSNNTQQNGPTGQPATPTPPPWASTP